MPSSLFISVSVRYPCPGRCSQEFLPQEKAPVISISQCSRFAGNKLSFREQLPRISIKIVHFWQLKGKQYFTSDWPWSSKVTNGWPRKLSLLFPLLKSMIHAPAFFWSTLQNWPCASFDHFLLSSDVMRTRFRQVTLMATVMTYVSMLSNNS